MRAGSSAGHASWRSTPIPYVCESPMVTMLACESVSGLRYPRASWPGYRGLPRNPSTESGTQSGVGSRRTPNRDAARTCSMISQITKEITTTTSRAQTLAPQRRHRLTVTIVFGSLNGVETGLLVVAQQPGVGLHFGFRLMEVVLQKP